MLLIEKGIKNCAIISSFAAVGDCLKPFNEQKGRVYTEDDWLPQTEKDCEDAEKNKKYVSVPRQQPLLRSSDENGTDSTVRWHLSCGTARRRSLPRSPHSRHRSGCRPSTLWGPSTRQVSALSLD